MLRTFLSFCVLVVGFSTFSMAQTRDPGSAAYYQFGMGSSIRVDANMLSRNGCGRVVSSGQYAPRGAHVEENAIPLTIVVDMGSGNCGNPRVIRRMTVIGSDLNTILVKIFFVSTSGRRLKTEKVGIQEG